MRRPFILVLAILLLLALRAEASSSTSLSGRVTDRSGLPLAGVTVELERSGISVRQLSDENGRFGFGDLTPGNYLLRGSKAGFLKTTFGALQFGGDGTPLVITSGSEASVSLMLIRAGVISGTIRDQFGEPTPDVLVTASLLQGAPQRVWTDHLGRYRIFGLPSGDYLISAQPPTGLRKFAYPALSLSDAEMDAKLRELKEGPGSARPGASSQPARISGLTTVYFPGTIDPNGAVSIPLSEGEELRGMDVRLAAAGTASVSGRLIGLKEAMGPGSQLLATNDLSGVSYGGSLAANGSFEFSGIPPGQYTVYARIVSGPSRGDVLSVSEARVTEWGQLPLQVSGDVVNAAVELRSPMSLAGSLTFDLGSSNSSLPVPDTLRVQMTGASLKNARTTVSAVPNADGSFVVIGVEPGSYNIDVRDISSNRKVWKVRSVSASGRDLIDPFEITSDVGNVAGVTIVLSDRTTTLSGTLRRSDGQPVSDCYVVAFPVDADVWKPGSRKLLAVRPDVLGRYEFVDPIAGDYFVGAIKLKPTNWESHEFLKSIQQAAVRVAIRDGQAVLQNLQIER